MAKTNKSRQVAADLASSWAQGFLGDLYFAGLGFEKDLVKSGPLTLEDPELGLMSAQTTLGAIYLRDHGPPKDRQEGFYWLYWAVDRGFDVAQSPWGQPEKKEPYG
ncbi:MAG: hypothetical protein LBT38_11295 [Deltaproteobacteria bacterium]|jgi:TPR repeat protein|nr:hypothetical protein [Deltaproteobacteria bacterium]